VDDDSNSSPSPESNEVESEHDADRAAILARRQRFIAIALSGFTTALSGCDSKPQPCLKVAPIVNQPNKEEALPKSGAASAQPTHEESPNPGEDEKPTSASEAPPVRPQACLKVAPRPCLRKALPRPGLIPPAPERSEDDPLRGL